MEGNVFVVFNVGTNDLPLGDISVKVNDNNYHVVRFVRNGANATLQIDDYNVQTLSPQGNNSIVSLCLLHYVITPQTHILFIMLFYVVRDQRTQPFVQMKTKKYIIISFYLFTNHHHCPILYHRQLTPAHY